MKLSVVATAGFIASALAGPLPAEIVRRQLLGNYVCTVSNATTAGEPLAVAFPAATAIGDIIGPVLLAAVGRQGVEQIDDMGDEFCANAEQDPTAPQGVCQEALNALYNFALATVPLLQAQEYMCLLNLLCLAPDGLPITGTCDYLFAGADCVANRILQVEDLECQ